MVLRRRVMAGAAALAAVAAFTFPVVGSSANPPDLTTPVGPCAGLTFLDDGICTVAPGETVVFEVVSGSGGPGGAGGRGGDAFQGSSGPSLGAAGGPGGLGGRAYTVSGSFTNTTGAPVNLYAWVGLNGLAGAAGQDGVNGTSQQPNGTDGFDGGDGEPGGGSAIFLDNPFIVTSLTVLQHVVIVSGGFGGGGGPGGQGGLSPVSVLDGVDGSITSPQEIPAGWLHGPVVGQSTPVVMFLAPVVAPAYTG